MAFVEYILLALLGSTAAAPGATPSRASVRTLAADTVAQPAGGEMSSGSMANSNSKVTKAQKGGKKGHKGGKKGKKSSGGTTTPPPK
jgi:hypothetical protein